MSKPLIILSLGAGVQSTTLALMAAHGEFETVPDCAIFADTQDEPAAVYEHLRWLCSPNVLPFSVHTISAGRLSAALRAGEDAARVPFFVGDGGMGKRQCTRNFKLRPIRRKAREVLGRPGHAYVPPGAVEQWIGISTDEADRIKPSGVKFIINRHPLIERGMSRRDCRGWLHRNGYPQPPKSACKYCPYKDREGWQQLADNSDDYEEVCRLDDWLREPEQIARFHGEMYVHPSRQPLRLLDLALTDPAQFDLWGNECEGMCGV